MPVSEFMKGSFVAGLKDDRIKYIVKATGEDSLAKLAVTALQEESELKSQKFKGNQGNLPWSNTGYSGPMRRDCRPQLKGEVNVVTFVKCYNCLGEGHNMKDCRKKPRWCTCRKVGHGTNNCRAVGLQVVNGMKSCPSNRAQLMWLSSQRHIWNLTRGFTFQIIISIESIATREWKAELQLQSGKVFHTTM
jgi:hypothetical protein